MTLKRTPIPRRFGCADLLSRPTRLEVTQPDLPSKIAGGGGGGQGRGGASAAAGVRGRKKCSGRGWWRRELLPPPRVRAPERSKWAGGARGVRPGRKDRRARDGERQPRPAWLGNPEGWRARAGSGCSAPRPEGEGPRGLLSRQPWPWSSLYQGCGSHVLGAARGSAVGGCRCPQVCGRRSRPRNPPGWAPGAAGTGPGTELCFRSLPSPSTCSVVWGFFC